MLGIGTANQSTLKASKAVRFGSTLRYWFTTSKETTIKYDYSVPIGFGIEYDKRQKKEVEMITKSTNQIAAQYDRIWKLHFKYEKGTEKMWQKVDEICGKFLCRMSY